jgi:hypothetical protein
LRAGKNDLPITCSVYVLRQINADVIYCFKEHLLAGDHLLLNEHNLYASCEYLSCGLIKRVLVRIMFV